MRSVALLTLFGLLVPAGGRATVLTADQAVKLALQKNTSVIGAEASVLSARSGLWSAYAEMVPNVSGTYDVRNTKLNPKGDLQTFQLGAQLLTFRTRSSEETDRSPSLIGSWSILSLSNLSNFSSARNAMTGARLNRQATRNDIALEARRRFYGVVRAIKLSEVSNSALKLSRDDERRVRALFEVGSVSKSDLLKARVRTAQSQLDSLVSTNGIVSSRISLGTLVGVAETDLGDIDTTLVAEHRSFDAGSVLSEARAGRPDLLGAERNLKSAQAELNAARLTRFPSVNLSGSVDLSTIRSQKASRDFFDSTGTTFLRTLNQDTRTTTDPSRTLALSLSVPIFDGFRTDARIAAARATLLRARETRDALVRNLEGEVRLTVLGYQESVEREALGRRALESAAENLNLVQQKYNVGSATILDLIDSQVQLQRAQSDLVSALADIRVAEAAVDRVRGKGE